MRIMIVDDNKRDAMLSCREAMLNRALFKGDAMNVVITRSGLLSVPDWSRPLKLEARYAPGMDKSYCGIKHFVNKPSPTGKKRTRWRMAKRSKMRNRN